MMKKLNFLTVLILSCTFLMSCAKSMADEPESRVNYHQQGIGVSAKDFLSDKRYKSLHLEIQYMPGNKPSEEAIRELKSFLVLYLNKPEGITVSMNEIPASVDSVLSVQAVKAIEDQYRKRHTRDQELSVYVLFTDGHSSNKDQLGFAYRNTSAVLFGKHIAEHSGKFKKPSRADLESRVLQHEFGHLLGLVNTATEETSEHQDHENGKHCINRRCLMYHQVDTHDYPSFLVKKDPPKLDDACIAALKAMAAK